MTRQISSLATAGFGNPLVSTAEMGASILMTVLTILAPFLAVFCLLLAMAYGARKLLFRGKNEEVVAA